MRRGQEAAELAKKVKSELWFINVRVFSQQFCPLRSLRLCVIMLLLKVHPKGAEFNFLFKN